MKKPWSRRPPLPRQPGHFQPVEEEAEESPAGGEEEAEEEERPPDLHFPVPPFLDGEII